MRSKRSVQRRLIVILGIILVVLSAFAALFAYTAMVQKSRSSTTTATTAIVAFDSPYVREFNLSNSAFPNGIATDASGNAWFVAQSNASLGVVYAGNSTIRFFHIPTKPKAISSWGVAVDSSRGLVWLTDETTMPNAIWSFSIANDTFREFPITSSNDTFPFQVAIDESHNVWFTEEYGQGGGKLGEILANNATMREYPVPSALTSNIAGPTGLTISPNGTIWFTDPAENSIASFANGAFRIYNFSGRALEPVGIAVDQSGNVWFTEHGPSLLAEFTAVGVLKTISTSLAPAPLYESLPYFCYVDAQGNIWFNEHQGNRIGKYTPGSNTMVEYSIPSEVPSFQNLSGSLTMALSPSGVPWFAEQFASKIGTLNLNETINESIVVANSTGGAPFTLSNGSITRVAFNLDGPANLQTSVNASISTIDLLPPVSFSFSTTNGVGSYSSILTVKDDGLAPGIYYITIGVFSQDVIVSKLVEIQVT